MHFLKRKSRTEIAQYLKVRSRSVNIGVSKYLNAELGSLVEKRRSGRPIALTDAQLKQLESHISQAEKYPDGGRLHTIDIQRYITNHFDVHFKISNVYRLLHQLNFFWITSRSKHEKQPEEHQDAFRKLPAGNNP